MARNNTSEPLFNLAEAATRLHMGQSTLRAKLYDGLGPVAIKLPGSNRWRFRPRDLDEYERNAEISPENRASAPPVAAQAISVNDSSRALKLKTSREIEPV